MSTATYNTTQKQNNFSQHKQTLLLCLLLPGAAVFADATPECNVGTGVSSTECGVGSDADGPNTVAIGNGSTALGTAGVAIGSRALVETGTSVAIGFDSEAINSSAISIGYVARAHSVGSISIGNLAGYNSNVSVTDSPQAIAIGNFSNISAMSSGAIAIGGDVDGDTKGSEAKAPGAIAIGVDSVSNLQDGIAIGNSASTNGAIGSPVAIGKSAYAGSRSVAVGSGATANSFFGGVSIGEGSSSLASNAIALGQFVSIDSPSENAIAIGYQSRATNALTGIAIGGDADFDNVGAQALATGAIAIGADVVNDVEDSMLINVPFRIETDKAPGTSPVLTIEDTTASAGVRNVIQLKNNGGVGFELRDTNLNNAWDFRTAGNGGFLVSNIGVPGSKLQVNQDGSVFFVDAKFNFNGPTGNLTLAGNSTALAHISTSSREVKTDFAKVDPKAVMDKIKVMEVTEWRYKGTAAKGKHIGPMAEDFYQLFGLGPDDKHVAATDMASIALVAAKELQKKSEASTADIKQLKAENANLKKQLDEQKKILQERIASLEKLVTNLASGADSLPKNGKQVALSPIE